MFDTQLSAIAANLPAGFMNRMALAYVVLRALYTLAYVTVTSRQGSLLRTVAFTGQLVVMVTLFFRAASVFAKF